MVWSISKSILPIRTPLNLKYPRYSPIEPIGSFYPSHFRMKFLVVQTSKDDMDRTLEKLNA